MIADMPQQVGRVLPRTLRQTWKTDPLNRVASYTYDSLGNLKTRTDAKNQTVTYAYQVRRLTTITYPNSSTDTFSYDTLGRRTGMSNANGTFTYAYDSLNRPTSVTNQRFGATISYTYDAAGNRSKMTTPKGDVTYIYDGKNRLTQITDPVFGQFGFAYDPMDRRTSLSYPNGITTNYQYDRAYRLTAMVAKDGPGNVLDAWSYTYDRVGNRLSKTNKDGQAEIYQYDPVYRLTRAIYANGVTEAFAYDPVGNRLSKTDGSGTTSYTYDVANQMLSAGGDTYTYDSNGSVISKLTAGGALTTFTYDFQNRVTQITGPQGNERSQYAPDGTRVDIYGSTVDTQYDPGEVGPQYDTISNPILDMGNDRLVWVYRLYGPGIDEPLAEWRRINTQTTFLHHDAIGSITAVSAPSRAVSYRITYNAFGERNQAAPPSGIITTRLSYTARENSVGSLMQYRSRFLEATTGRFLTSDAYRGRQDAPPSLNRYAYVHGNPIRYRDPSGHYVEWNCDYLSVTAGQGLGGLFLRMDCSSNATSPMGMPGTRAIIWGFGVGPSLGTPIQLSGGGMTLRDYGGTRPPVDTEDALGPVNAIDRLEGRLLFFSAGVGALAVGFGVTMVSITDSDLAGVTAGFGWTVNKGRWGVGWGVNAAVGFTVVIDATYEPVLD